MKMKRKSKISKNHRHRRKSPRISIFHLNLLHKIGTNISCMFQRLHTHVNCSKTNKLISVSLTLLTCDQNGCFKQRNSFSRCRKRTWTYKLIDPPPLSPFIIILFKLKFGTELVHNFYDLHFLPWVWFMLIYI